MATGSLRNAVLICLAVSLTVINTAQSKCEDKDTNCWNYDASKCKSYSQWAHDHCAKRCKLCYSDAVKGYECHAIPKQTYPTNYQEQVNCEATSGCLAHEYSLKCGAVCLPKQCSFAQVKERSHCMRYYCPTYTQVRIHKGMFIGH